MSIDKFFDKKMKETTPIKVNGIELYCIGDPEKNQEVPYSVQPTFSLRFEPETSRLRSSVNHSTANFSCQRKQSESWRSV